MWLDTPKGEMRVLFVETMGPDGDHEWTCVNDYGEVWTFLNYAVRVVKNVTYEIESRK